MFASMLMKLLRRVGDINIHLAAKRLIRRPTLISGTGTTFSSAARILNAGKKSSNISVGENCRIEGELFVFAHGGEIKIGNWCFLGPGSKIWSARKISIGNRVLIAHNVTIMDSLTHSLRPEERHAHFRSILASGHPEKIDLDGKEVVIHEDAWIGAGAIILRGVEIGVGSIVGAGAVVTKDVSAFTVVAGNPAKVVKTLKANESNEQ